MFFNVFCAYSFATLVVWVLLMHFGTERSARPVNYLIVAAAWPVWGGVVWIFYGAQLVLNFIPKQRKEKGNE